MSLIRACERQLIEKNHPIEIAFGVKDINARQRSILTKLPGYGSQVILNKRDISMHDLSALTAKTGDEFAVFTRKGKRLVIRGNNEHIPLKPHEIISLRDSGYRWSGHTHPGFTAADLVASDGDLKTLILFGQTNSAIYNAAGRFKLIK